MINISDRLKAIANYIDKGETMADIGTDHGFLPIYLWEREISPKVIMADVSSGSLAKARETGQIHYPEKAFDLRLGDGFKILENGEVDDVVIAGMGGILMTEIIGEDIKKSKSFKKIVLQPRSAVGPLRYWLYHNGFTVKEEILVRESKFICEILEVVLGKDENIDDLRKEASPESICWEVPKWYGERKDEALWLEYIVRKLRREEKILESMKKSKSADFTTVEEKINYLKVLLEVD